MLALWATLSLILAAVALAITLTWARWAARPMPVDVLITGSTCYPKVDRSGRER